MRHLPKGHVLYKGNLYLRPSHAGILLGVSGFTVTRWFKEGKIAGILLPAKTGQRNVLYVPKAFLANKFFQFKCMLCGKIVTSKRLRNPKNNRFCSDKCCFKWWNQHYPVDSKGKRKKHTQPIVKRRCKEWFSETSRLPLTERLGIGLQIRWADYTEHRTLPVSFPS